MPTELEELVEFLHHGNTEIRQVAAEHLLGYSSSQPIIFKADKLRPVKDLKLLVKDYAPIAKNAIDILINISDDPEILEVLASDEAFVESILLKITSSKEPNANPLAMLLANLAKHDTLQSLLTSTRPIPKELSNSPLAMDQLMDCFVKGAESKYNPTADYHYLAYFLADMAKHAAGRKYFVTPREEDEGIVPITKLTVFTEYKSVIRRRGVASTIKNVCFEIDSHAQLLDTDGINLLPYLLLPLMGSEEYSDEDTEGMLDELQLLSPDKEREPDNEIIKTHLESLLLLTTTRDAREFFRKVKVYPIIRECHLHVEDEGVRDACDRIVQVIMRDEAPEGEEDGEANAPEVKEDQLTVRVGTGDDNSGTETTQTSTIKEEVDNKVTEVDSDDEIVDIV